MALDVLRRDGAATAASPSPPAAGRPGGASVRLDSLVKTFRGARAVDDVSLDIAAGSFVSLLGPSGSGKTTTLNLIAGFLAPDSGRLLFDGRLVSTTPPHKRDIGMVFQSYALFPHLTVFDNVAYPLRMRTRLKGDALRAQVEETLDLVRLNAKRDQYPRQLSGGQQQRVSMARALVSRPRLLLMDEPLGALDKKLREDLQSEIRALHAKLGSTFIYVTHDQSEALTMSDMLVVMRDGQIAQTGSPREVYDKPRSVFVASFLGDANLLPATVLKPSGEQQELDLGEGLVVALPRHGSNTFLPGSDVVLLVRPEDMRLGQGAPDAETLRATLVDVMFLGNSAKVTVRIGRSELGLLAHPADTAGMAVGDAVPVAWNRARARLLPHDT